jgi:hypothetical protein
MRCQECLKHRPNLFPEAVDAELAVGISVGDASFSSKKATRRELSST